MASWKKAGSRGRLLTPTMTPLSMDGCLTFAYHMWGTDMGILNVLLIQGSNEIMLWSLAGDQDNQWKLAQISLSFDGVDEFQIAFDGYVADHVPPLSQVLGDIAIDAVSVNRISSCSSTPPKTVTASSATGSTTTIGSSGVSFNTAQGATSKSTNSPGGISIVIPDEIPHSSTPTPSSAESSNGGSTQSTGGIKSNSTALGQKQKPTEKPSPISK